jgi:hypothetical protein
MPNIVFMPVAVDVLLLSLVLYFVSVTGTGRSFENRSRHKH